MTYARRIIPHSESNQSNQLVSACFVVVCHIIRHVGFLGGRGKGVLLVLGAWFSCLKIRNAVSSSRNGHIYIKERQKETNNNIPDVFCSNTKTRARDGIDIWNTIDQGSRPKYGVKR